MQRRTVLATLLAGVAGCSRSTPPGDRDSTSTTATVEPLDVETPPPGDCTVERPRADGVDGSPPPAYPDPPGEFTTASVERYVERFERAYQSHRLHLEHRDSPFELRVRLFDVSVSVTTTEDGHRADVEGSVDLLEERPETATPETTPATPTETVTAVWSEPSDLKAAYYLTGRFVLRDDSVVACFDG